MTDAKRVSKTATRLFLATIIALILLFTVAQVIVFGLFTTNGIDVSQLANIELSSGQLQILRLGLFLSNLLIFTGSAVFGLRYVFQNNWGKAVHLDRKPRGGSIWLAIGFFLVTLPIVGYSAYLNLQLPLPDWAVRSEAATDALIVQMMQMDSVPALILSILTVGVAAGLGEELLLRGSVQGRILQGWLGNHHAAIWLAAALFSAMHIEFAGFFPRLFLGLSLGYAYHWTRSLWVPIILHFCFNSIQVVAAYVSGTFDPTAGADEAPAIWLVLACLPLATWIFYRAEKAFGDEPVLLNPNGAAAGAMNGEG